MTDLIAFVGVTPGPFTGGSVNAFAHSPSLDRWVAGGNGGSSDVLGTAPTAGSPWTTETTPWDAGGVIQSLIRVETLGLYVAGGSPGVGSAIMTSPDGLTWTNRTCPLDYVLGLAWSEDDTLLAAVGGEGGNTIVVATSPDGINWTPQTTPMDGGFAQSVAHDDANGSWVVGAFGSGNPVDVMTSPDATTWTGRTSAYPGDGASAMASAGGRTVAALNSTANQASMYSDDGGLTWTDSPSAGAVLRAGTSVAVHPATGLWGMGGFDGSFDGAFAVSTDGSTWAANTIPFTGTVWATAWSDNVWLIGDDAATLVAVGEEDSPPVLTQYQRIYGWTVSISDDALETVDPVLVSPEVGA